MLPDAYRLKKRRDFSRIYARGKHQACSAFVLYRLPRRRTTEIRIGFSASKKLGHAVERNRIKRVFRHAAAAILPSFTPGCDYVFLIRPAAFNYSFDQLQRQMVKLLSREPEKGCGKGSKTTGATHK